MKKIFCVLLSVIIGWGGISYATNDTSVLQQKLEKEVSRGMVFEFMSDYLLSDIPDSYQYIQLYYADIIPSQKEYTFLQKIVYTGALPNNKSKVALGSMMNSYQFYSLIRYITGYDFITEQNRSLLKNRNVMLSDLVMVRDVVINADDESQEDEDRLEDYLSVLKTPDEQEKMKIFFDVYYTLVSEYYGSDTLDTNALLYSSIQGLVSGAQDQFSVFFKPEQSKDFEDELAGEFDGIGAYIDVETSGILKIISPISGTPSEKVGLKGGDIITKIDDLDVTSDITAQKAAQLIKGPAGTTVKLEILRGDNILQFEIVREKIILKDVEYKELNDEFFYIQIRMFGEKVFDQFKDSILALKESSKKKVIIDLRNNPGGYLDQVTEMLSLFIDNGQNVAVIQYPGYEYNYTSAGYNMLSLGDYEVYILVNSGTASASEIMTGTLKDYFPNNVTIIGEKTYGKGSVQTMRAYPDGSMLKYTIAKWATGKTKTQIDKIGIQPDKEVILDEKGFQEGIDNQLDFILNP